MVLSVRCPINTINMAKALSISSQPSRCWEDKQSFVCVFIYVSFTSAGKHSDDKGPNDHGNIDCAKWSEKCPCSIRQISSIKISRAWMRLDNIGINTYSVRITLSFTINRYYRLFMTSIILILPFFLIITDLGETSLLIVSIGYSMTRVVYTKKITG